MEISSQNIISPGKNYYIFNLQFIYIVKKTQANNKKINVLMLNFLLLIMKKQRRKRSLSDDFLRNASLLDPSLSIVSVNPLFGKKNPLSNFKKNNNNTKYQLINYIKKKIFLKFKESCFKKYGFKKYY